MTSSPSSTTAGPAAPPLGNHRIEAVLFDMDGVVTDTAEAHAAAWKRLFDEYLKGRAERRGETFEPFDVDRDYREYVDGKPRYDGVRDFLAARGIQLPGGAADDGPDQETIRGLGNRKNRHFHAWLEEHRVEAFAGTLALIEALKGVGIRVAVFSASRNAEAVLRSAGVLGLFDAKVDGRDMAELGLPGKPDPAILKEAASRLGVAAERTAIVEDAIAGVQAGVRGGFAPVVGVDRAAVGDRLKAAGAHLVVGDLAELELRGDRRLAVKTLASLPSLWASEPALRKRLEGRRLAVFLDYDGTLTPIVEDHTKANLDADVRRAVAELARMVTVAIVSGRDLEDLRKRVALESVFLAGSHGFDIGGPKNWHKTLQKGTEFLPELDRAEAALHERLASIDGASIERKKFSIAVHYRRVRDSDVGRVRETVDHVLEQQPSLHENQGKKVFDIQPRIDWNKGRAIDWLLGQLELDGPDVLAFYLGDDVTDEDAFRRLAGRGVTIAVGDGARQTAADFALADPADVRRFLEWLSARAGATGQG